MESASEKDDARLLRAVRQARPDLIALTGDFADELTELSALEPLLEGLTALAPVFYVTGNHEWVMDGAQRRELFALLDGCGVVRLRNSWRVLKSGGCRIVLAGVDDPNGPADQKTPEALVAEIRAAEGGDAFIVMLAHRNDQLARWAALGVDAVLAGHAHGGIVRLPGIGPVFGTHYEFFPEFTRRALYAGRDAAARQPGPRRELSPAAADRKPAGASRAYSAGGKAGSVNIL